MDPMFGTLSADNFSIDGTYKDYVHKSKYTVNTGAVSTFSVLVTLEPGLYALGFGCDMLNYDDRDECDFYNINSLHLTYIDITLSSIDEVSYKNLLEDNKFYSNMYGRTSYTSDNYGISPPEDIYQDASDYIHQVYHTSTSSSLSLSYLEQTLSGAYYKFSVPEFQRQDSNIDEFSARLRLWYRSDLPEGSSFKIFVRIYLKSLDTIFSLIASLCSLEK